MHVVYVYIYEILILIFFPLVCAFYAPLIKKHTLK